MSVDNEAHVVTLLISRFNGPTRFFGGAHRGIVCVHVFVALGSSEVLIGVRCVRAFIGVSI